MVWTSDLGMSCIMSFLGQFSDLTSVIPPSFVLVTLHSTVYSIFSAC